MGMFDYVNFEMNCPHCGSFVGGFQSKDRACVMEWVEPKDLVNFYSGCKCGAWIEFSKPATYHEEKPRVPATEREVLALGFTMRCDPPSENSTGGGKSDLPA